MKKLAPAIGGAMTSLLRPVAVTGATVVTAASVFAAPASAHDAVVESNPAANSTIKEIPRKISLTFSGVPQDGYNTIALTKDGERIVSEKPHQDGKELSIDVPGQVESTPGEYIIGYQITSSDGHATRGSLKFTVADDGHNGAPGNGAGDSSQNKSAEQSSSQGEDPLGGLGWLLPIAGIVVIGGALVMAIARWRNLNSDNRSED